MQGLRRQWLVAHLATLAALSFLPGCAQPSVSAAQGGNSGPQHETAATRDLRQKILTQYGGAYSDRKVGSWIAAIGQRLTAQSGHPELHFTFIVLDTGIVNAFSTQGGDVYVTRGLLALAGSDAEVAAVLGHEIGHVVDRDRAIHAPSPPAGIVHTGADLLSELPRGVAQPPAGYSRAQEYQADDFGIMALNNAGYDPLAMARVLTSIVRDAEFQTAPGSKEAADGGAFEGGHPLTRDRIDRARQTAASEKPTASAETGRETYLTAIDGMMFGDGPDRGYLRRGMFVHPGAGFAFAAPEGFVWRASATAVTATRSDGTTLSLTSAAPGIAPSPLDYLVEIWGRDIVLQSPSPITINSRPAAFSLAYVQSDQGPLDAYLLVIGWSPSLVYRLAFLTPPGSADRAASVFWPTANSFRALTPSDAAIYPPPRLRVVTVTRRDTLAGIVRRMATAEPKDERFRVLNGLQPGEPLHAGMRVKIVE